MLSRYSAKACRPARAQRTCGKLDTRGVAKCPGACQDHRARGLHGNDRARQAGQGLVPRAAGAEEQRATLHDVVDQRAPLPVGQSVGGIVVDRQHVKRAKHQAGIRHVCGYQVNDAGSDASGVDRCDGIKG